MRNDMPASGPAPRTCASASRRRLLCAALAAGLARPVRGEAADADPSKQPPQPGDRAGLCLVGRRPARRDRRRPGARRRTAVGLSAGPGQRRDAREFASQPNPAAAPRIRTASTRRPALAPSTASSPIRPFAPTPPARSANGRRTSATWCALVIPRNTTRPRAPRASPARPRDLCRPCPSSRLATSSSSPAPSVARSARRLLEAMT
jgi:hypothetical protein